MKKTKAMSIFAAALMVTSIAASVSAADYAEDPGFLLPDVTPGFKTGNTGATPVTSGSASESAAAKVATAINSRSITAAIKRGTAVKASYKKADIKAAAMAALAKAKGVLKVTTARYDVEIDAASITEATDIDLAIKITKDSSKGALILRTAQAGSYGCTVKVCIPAKIYDQAGVDVSEASVYCIDTASKSAEKLGAVEVDGDGNIVLELTEGGTLVIL